MKRPGIFTLTVIMTLALQCAACMPAGAEMSDEPDIGDIGFTIEAVESEPEDYVSNEFTAREKQIERAQRQKR